MRFTALTVVLLAGSVAASAADPGLLNLVMPDAKVLAGVNVTSTKISPFGTYMLGQIPAGDQGLQQLIATTGFDPRNDLTEILAASPAPSGTVGKQPGIVLARGTFHVDQIVAAVNDHADGKQSVDTYNGATLISNNGAKRSSAVAFIGNSIAIAGPTDLVKAAIDRTTTPASIDTALAVKVADVSGREDAWMVSSVPASAVLPAQAAQAAGPAAPFLNILKNVQSSSAGVKFGANADFMLQAVTSDPQNANALRDMIRLVQSLAATKAPNPILTSLQVTTDGANVNVTVSVPEAELEALIRNKNSHPNLRPKPAVKRGEL